MGAPATEAAIERIRQLVIAGQLPPGSRLPAESELATTLGLSRNSTREAVRALVTARVLDVRRGDGTYVTSLRPELLLEGIGFAVELMQDDSALELVEVRRLLEPRAVALAATRSTPSALYGIGAALSRMRHATDHAAFVRHDAEFHDLINRASGNETLASLLRGVSSSTLRARVWRDILDSGASSRTIAEHERIMLALQSGDERAAAEASAAHVRSTENWLRHVLDADARPIPTDPSISSDPSTSSDISYGEAPMTS